MRKVATLIFPYSYFRSLPKYVHFPFRDYFSFQFCFADIFVLLIKDKRPQSRYHVQTTSRFLLVSGIVQIRMKSCDTHSRLFRNICILRYSYRRVLLFQKHSTIKNLSDPDMHEIAYFDKIILWHKSPRKIQSCTTD